MVRYYKIKITIILSYSEPSYLLLWWYFIENLEEKIISWTDWQANWQLRPTNKKSGCHESPKVRSLSEPLSRTGLRAGGTIDKGYCTGSFAHFLNRQLSRNNKLLVTWTLQPVESFLFPHNHFTGDHQAQSKFLLSNFSHRLQEDPILFSENYSPYSANFKCKTNQGKPKHGTLA